MMLKNFRLLTGGPRIPGGPGGPRSPGSPYAVAGKRKAILKLLVLLGTILNQNPELDFSHRMNSLTSRLVGC